MQYARSQCTCTEVYEPKHTYTFTGPCFVLRTPYSVTVPAEGLFAYNQGAKIQDAFPDLSVEDREFLISGTSPEGWKLLFGPPDVAFVIANEIAPKGVTIADVLLWFQISYDRYNGGGWTEVKDLICGEDEDLDWVVDQLLECKDRKVASYQVLPRAVAFKDGKAISTGNSAEIAKIHDNTVQVLVVGLPTDHYDFAGPVDVVGKTLEEIKAEVEKMIVP